MYPALQAASAKFDRARKDCETLHSEVKALCDREPYRIAVDLEPKTGWHIARVETVEEPAPSLAVLYGAIAYQCRSALNLVVWELAGRKVGRRKLAANRDLAGAVQFPIATSFEAFISNGVRKHISKHAEAVIKALQPYHRPHPDLINAHPLCIIKMLSDADKHRVLPGGFGALRFDEVEFGWDAVARDPTIEPLIGPPPGYLEEKTAVAQLRFGVGNAEANVRVDRQPDAEVMFECGEWALSMRDIKNCVATTRRCLHQMAVLFPGQEFPWPTETST